MCPAPEARKIIAHGGTVGLIANNFKAPDGAAENQLAGVSVAPSGALFVIALGPTAEAVGYSRSPLCGFKRF